MSNSFPRATTVVVIGLCCLVYFSTAETELRIGGATLPEVIYNETTFFFNKRYQNTYKASYDPVGSGNGRQGLLNGTYDIGCSDVFQQLDNVTYFPTMAVPIVPFHSISTILPNQTLALSRECLGDIFAGIVTHWRDLCITATNSDVLLPNSTITIIVPSWKSGTSKVFTQALSVFSPAFRAKYNGSFEEPSIWDNSTVRLSGADDTETMIEEMLSQDNSLTFGGAPSGKAVDAPVVSLINKAGNPVLPKTASIEEATINQIQFNNGIASLTNASLIDASGGNSWPIVTLTYVLVKNDRPDCDVTLAALKYLTWFYTSDVVLLTLVSESVSALPSVLRRRFLEQIENTLKCRDGSSGVSFLSWSDTVENAIVYVLKDAIIEKNSGRDFDDEIEYMIATQEDGSTSDDSLSDATQKIASDTGGVYFTAALSQSTFPSVKWWKLGYFPLQMSLYLSDCNVKACDIVLDLSVGKLKAIFSGNESLWNVTSQQQVNSSCLENALQACEAVSFAVPDSLPRSLPFLQAIANVLGVSTDEVLSRADIIDGIDSLPFRMTTYPCVIGFHLPVEKDNIIPFRLEGAEPLTPSSNRSLSNDSVITSPLSVPAWAILAWPPTKYNQQGCTTNRVDSLDLLQLLGFKTWGPLSADDRKEMIDRKDTLWQRVGLWLPDIIPENENQKLIWIVDNCTGYYCPKGMFSEQHGVECRPCPPGQYADLRGAKVCTVCDAGYEVNDDRSKCEACSSGFYYDDKSKSCRQCPNNETTWWKIAMNVEAAEDFSWCNCKQGFYRHNTTRNCTECPRGWLCEGASLPPINEEFYYDIEYLEKDDIKEELRQADELVSFCLYRPDICYNSTEICPIGYSKSSLWCSGCEEGFVSVDKDCFPCGPLSNLTDWPEVSLFYHSSRTDAQSVNQTNGIVSRWWLSYLGHNIGNFIACGFFAIMVLGRTSSSDTRFGYTIIRWLEFFPILTTHFQLLSVVMSLDFEWPSSFNVLFSDYLRIAAGMAWINIENFRLQCILPWLTWGVTTLLYSLLFPFSIVTILISFFIYKFVFRERKPLSRLRYLYNLLVSVKSWSDVRARALALGSIYYLPVSYRAITALIYTRVGHSNVKVLQGRPEVYYIENSTTATFEAARYKQDDIYPFAVGIFVMITLTIPVLLLAIWRFILERRQKTFSSSALAGRFRPGLGVWHAIELLHKLLIACFAQILYLNTKAFLIVALESCVLIMLLKMKPYDSPYLNRTAIAFEAAVVFQLLMALCFVDTSTVVHLTQVPGRDTSHLASIVGSLILVGHVMSLLFFIYCAVLQGLRHSHRYLLKKSLETLENTSKHLTQEVETVLLTSEPKSSVASERSSSSSYGHEEDVLRLVVHLNNFKGYLFSSPEVHTNLIAFVDQQVFQSTEHQFIALFFAHVLRVHEQRRYSSSWIAAENKDVLRQSRFGFYSPNCKPEEVLPSVSEVFSKKALRLLSNIMLSRATKDVDLIHGILVRFQKLEKAMEAKEAEVLEVGHHRYTRFGSISDFFDDRVLAAFADTLQFYYVDDHTDNPELFDRYRIIFNECFHQLARDVGFHFDAISQGLSSQSFSMLKYINALKSHRSGESSIESPLFAALKKNISKEGRSSEKDGKKTRRVSGIHSERRIPDKVAAPVDGEAEIEMASIKSASDSCV